MLKMRKVIAIIACTLTLCGCAGSRLVSREGYYLGLPDSENHPYSKYELVPKISQRDFHLVTEVTVVTQDDYRAAKKAGLVRYEQTIEPFLYFSIEKKLRYSPKTEVAGIINVPLYNLERKKTINLR